MACAVGKIQLLQILQRAGARFDRIKNTCRDVYCDVLESVGPSFPDSLESRNIEGQGVISGFSVILANIHGQVLYGYESPGVITYGSYGETWHTDSK